MAKQIFFLEKLLHLKKYCFLTAVAAISILTEPWRYQQTKSQ